MSPIQFEAKLMKIGAWTLIRLPENASAQLPSRGLIMVEGSINGLHIQTTLEPDGKGSHWFKVDTTMLKAAKADKNHTVTLALEPTKAWSEPEVPADLKSALTSDSQVNQQWLEITPLARWEWIRWIRATKQPETRKRRIEIACSKLKKGDRRPCCFNRNSCTEPDVSKNGILLEPEAL
jgi:hypothetical protein